MSIKMKKIELTKMLIGSSLLLSAIGLPLALTSCSKKSDIAGDDKKGKEDKEQKYHYLFKLEPELFDKENKNIVKDKFIAENSVKDLLNAKNGYDKDFFSKLDKSFGEKAVFYEKDGNEENENDNDKYKKVDDLGETVVYYLNTNDISKTDQHVSFAIDQEVFGKINKIDEIKKYISYAQIVDMKDFNVGTEKIEDGLVLEKNDNDASFVKFYKEDGTNQFVEEKEDVKKIKKVKIVLDQTIESKSLGSDGKVGFLVTFTPIDSNVKKTIIFKYANDKDCNFFKNNFYEEFEKGVKKIIDNDCAVISGDNDHFIKYVNKKINEIKLSSSSSIKNLENFAEESKKDNQKTEWKIKNFDGLVKSEDALNDLNEFLKNNLKITLDIQKCKSFNTYCFDYSALAKKDEDGNNFKYSFIINDDSKSETIKDNKDKNGIDFEISIGEDKGKHGELGTFDLPLDSFGEANEIVVKLAFKYNGIDFYSKDIVVKSKNNN